MRFKSVAVASVACLCVTLAGQVEMSAPIIKASDETIKMTVSFKGFENVADYRVGIGVSKGALDVSELTLHKNGEPVQLASGHFKQGFTSAWFGVPEVTSEGFVILGSSVGGSEDRFTMRVAIPRSKADSSGRIYIFAAKKYGPTTWYVEDGSYAEKTDW